MALGIENPPENEFTIEIAASLVAHADFVQPLFTAEIPFDVLAQQKNVPKYSDLVSCADIFLVEIVRSQDHSNMFIRLRFRWQVEVSFGPLETVKLEINSKIHKSRRRGFPIVQDESVFSLPIKFLPSDLSQIPKSIRGTL